MSPRILSGVSCITENHRPVGSFYNFVYIYEIACKFNEPFFTRRNSIGESVWSSILDSLLRVISSSGFATSGTKVKYSGCAYEKKHSNLFMVVSKVSLDFVEFI